MAITSEQGQSEVGPRVLEDGPLASAVGNVYLLDQTETAEYVGYVV